MDDFPILACFHMVNGTCQAIRVSINGNHNLCSVGHWANVGTLIRGGKEDKQKLPATVTQPEEWHSLKVQLRGDKLLWHYDNRIIGETTVERPAKNPNELLAGFHGSDATLVLKDFRIVTQ